MQQVTLFKWPYPKWIAHRGAGKLAPENTLAAFRLGASQGYRMFECDIKLSEDGVPFLLHDDTLNRTTNAKGVAGDHEWSFLAQLDAGSWHSRSFAGEPLPSFENIAHFCLKNGYFLNIEIKPTPGIERETGVVIAQHALRLWKTGSAPTSAPPLLTSFHSESLEGAKATAPHLPRGLLLDTLWKGWLETALTLECVAIICNHALWDKSTVTQAKSAGFRCLSYTVNDEWAAQRLLNLGIDGIITDRVDLFSPAG
ncbi:MAG: glycerophosphodiester phosphodiesterase [Burkholderiaceae bacterium]|nr:glycerophosphodiester phosphodiesterase [Burkholderiaceae bacterium]